MKTKKYTAILAGIVFLTVSANSALASLITFDFKDPNIDAPITSANSNESTNNLYSWTSGDYKLFVSANTGVGSGAESVLYLDNITNPNVGIGVDDDAGGSDEEIELGESVNFNLTGPAGNYALVGLELWSPSHSTTFDSNLNVFINGTDIDAAHILDFSSSPFNGQQFDIGISFDPNTVPGEGLYIGAATFSFSPVPEPTTMLLFGTGLVGLAGVARRKKK